MRVFIPVAPGRQDLAGVAVRLLERRLPEVSVCIISNKKTFDTFPRKGKRVPQFLDENEELGGLSLETIRRLLPENQHRSGWYYQQFIKYQVAAIVNEPFYGVLDADTLLLRELPLFRADDPVFVVKEEFHPPYFKTIENLLGLEKIKPHSYIAEGMLFRTDLIAELMVRLKGKGATPWFERVLASLGSEERAGAGFSEFETYGTFVDHFHPGLYRHLKLNVLRSSGLSYGPTPSSVDLAALSRKYDIATFERHEKVGPGRVFINKAKAVFGFA